MVANNRRIQLPNITTPVLNPDGTMNPVWYQYHQTIFNRTGGQLGNNSAYFNFPETLGEPGQRLTSAGSSSDSVTPPPATWETLNVPTNVSQLNNDSGYVDSTQIQNYATLTDLDSYATLTYITSLESSTTPLVDQGAGYFGNSTEFARADHYHPTDTSKVSLAQMIGTDANPGYFFLPGTSIRVAFGSTTVTTDANGNATVPYGTTFPTAVITFIPVNGNISTNTGSPGALGAYGLSGAAIYTGAISKQYQVNWIAVGY